MLRRWNSPTPSFGALREHECPRCHRPVDLPLGEICAHCRREIDARATRVARLVAMLSTLALGIYVMVRVPRDPTARMASGGAVAAWYLLTYLLVRRVLREYLK